MTDVIVRPPGWNCFFDLAFVLCVSVLTRDLGQAWFIVPVWWIWNQFTWYSSHFDNDDLLFRVFMLSGIAGSLVLARGLDRGLRRMARALALGLGASVPDPKARACFASQQTIRAP